MNRYNEELILISGWIPTELFPFSFSVTTHTYIHAQWECGDFIKGDILFGFIVNECCNWRWNHIITLTCSLNIYRETMSWRENYRAWHWCSVDDGMSIAVTVWLLGKSEDTAWVTWEETCVFDGLKWSQYKTS